MGTIDGGMASEQSESAIGIHDEVFVGEAEGRRRLGDPAAAETVDEEDRDSEPVELRCPAEGVGMDPGRAMQHHHGRLRRNGGDLPGPAGDGELPCDTRRPPLRAPGKELLLCESDTVDGKDLGSDQNLSTRH